MTVKCIYKRLAYLPISKGLLFWDTIHCWWPKTHLPFFDLHTTQFLPAYKRFQKSLLNSKGYVRSWNFSNKNMIDQSSNCVCVNITKKTIFETLFIKSLKIYYWKMTEFRQSFTDLIRGCINFRIEMQII